MLDLKELHERVIVKLREHPTSRRGQAYMNCLCEMDINLYRQVSASEKLDCFYSDSKIPTFLAWLDIDRLVLDVAAKYEFQVEFCAIGNHWVIRHSELNCELFWSSRTSIDTFWYELRNHFQEIGAERLALSVLT
jgi:hypothetical protein